jgi:hypothetical protein
MAAHEAIVAWRNSPEPARGSFAVGLQVAPAPGKSSYDVGVTAREYRIMRATHRAREIVIAVEAQAQPLSSAEHGLRAALAFAFLALLGAEAWLLWNAWSLWG